ncbi:hypothetical protein [Exiguobacterium acetylicum]|uniref:hypothetical protein n=1 Tax=Exiguobacterium acetylicum TaxID=41170 RepID=UPI001EE2AAE6|nr:hypothetical protein [Exiguobacterium acetylicum]UKS57293.1 hypothetical protein K6T22_06675 [Exiguobacterium acetylicum]
MFVNKTQIVLSGEAPEILAAFYRLTKGLQVDVLKQTENLMQLDITSSRKKLERFEEQLKMQLGGPDGHSFLFT